ncbi:interferon-induced protein 44-like isoform X1 [Pygocentrus nattereri]|uniref:interferon-induced protein 44-like isoform X1 n=1 Tax=Pygocentrus nattereri TaxID=42514 RepID=UPI0018919DA6|nr:interferon-induced protein 44-like isoform X1 [Pygocentrus nattereri]
MAFSFGMSKVNSTLYTIEKKVEAEDAAVKDDQEVTTFPKVPNFTLGQAGGFLQNQSPGKNRASKNEKREDAVLPLGATTLGSIWSPPLPSPWRNVTWTKETKDTLMEMVKTYKPASDYVSEARVLLLGPVGAGKSSFISSVQSVFSGRVLNRAMVGSSSSTGFTKKSINSLQLQSFSIRAGREKTDGTTALALCDVMGIGEGEMTGLTLHDALCVIQGHVPEGHQFVPEQPVKSETSGYIKKPGLKDKVHCVVFVVDASKINTYSKVLSSTFQKLREHISNLGVHQVALLTHVDEVCKETSQDITHVYRSSTVQQLMAKAGALLGMATSYIVPVKNYSAQLELEESTDILLLTAVDHILQYVHLYFQDTATECKRPFEA